MENQIECYFENQKKVIINEILQAKYQILVCMAWITDEDYLKAIISAKNNNKVEVKIITSARYSNINFSLFNKYRYNIDYLGFINLPFYMGIMHKKYCIIDKKILLTGSFNWTRNAELNSFENLLKINNPNVINQFLFDFVETEVFSFNEMYSPARCNENNCNGKLFNILCIEEGEDQNLQAECRIFSICSKCGQSTYITNDYEFNILNTLSSDVLDTTFILKFLNEHAERNFSVKIHAIAVPFIEPNTLCKTYKVIYKNKYFKRFIEDYYDFD